MANPRYCEPCRVHLDLPLNSYVVQGARCCVCGFAGQCHFIPDSMLSREDSAKLRPSLSRTAWERLLEG